MEQGYADAVKLLIHRTPQCIAFGRIRTEDELRIYIVDLAGLIVRYRHLAFAINDLLTHARQTACIRFLRVPPPRTSPTTEVDMTVTLLCKTGSASGIEA